jgi:hypothetical protein
MFDGRPENIQMLPIGRFFINFHHEHWYEKRWGYGFFRLMAIPCGKRHRAENPTSRQLAA